VSSRLGLNAEISYSDVAGRAAEVGKKRLAVQLLDHEVRADKQVPLLLKLGQGAQALNKAIDSGDTDLIYHVILSLQEQHSTADFHMIIRGVELGARLYKKYCSQYSPAALQSWLQQEDDWASLARQSVIESYATGRIETRLSALVTAQDYYKKGRCEFDLSATEETSDCSIAESDNWKGAQQCVESWECRGARMCERGGWCSGFDGCEGSPLPTQAPGLSNTH